ncbi:MAG: TRAM domain-containing protein, partial [Actinomycetes bacterium]
MPEVTVGPIAHGGHVVAHVDGRTVFVRGALPAERVLIEITETTSKVSRAHVVKVLDPSPDRIEAPCAWAGVCGGCDFQHVDLSAQRRLKSAVLAESFSRFAGVDLVGLLGSPVSVQAVPGDLTGLGWRSRMRWSHGDKGWGLRTYRSHDVVAVDRCIIAVESISNPPVPETTGEQSWAAVGTDAASVTVTDTSRNTGPVSVVQDVRGRVWRMHPDSFWQVHVGAASLLSDRVQALAQVETGSLWWDLYSGAGLFAAVLGEGVGPTGRVEAVEESTQAHR